MKALNRRLGSARYILFFDLEGTQFSHEVISIGACLGKIGKDGRIVSTKKGFYTLVKAREKVNRFIYELTGINQEMIDKGGVDFVDAIKDLRKYVGIAWPKTKFMAFGFGDMLMLRSSVKHQPQDEKLNATIEHIANNYIDFQAFFNQYIKDDKSSVLSLNNSLQRFNINFEGVQHNALADAKNLLSLYNAFQGEYDIVIDEYKKVLMKNKKSPRPVTKVLKALEAGRTVTPQMYNQFIEEDIRD